MMTPGEIRDAPPINIPASTVDKSKIKQAWGHSPCWVLDESRKKNVNKIQFFNF